jgi:hypothetical protein
MKIRQKLIINQTVAAVLGWTIVASLAANVNASSLTVTDVTDWNTTPVEVVSADLPLLGYDGGGILAGINTLEVTDGTSSTIHSGFCIDPFHWSAIGPSSPYYLVPLADAPKAPGQLNAATAKDIEDLWAEYYSPTMSSPAAAGLQIAIWELVSSNAVATDGLPPADAITMTGDTYGASADLASLATYHGPAANLIALTGPGQDYVIAAVPDGGGTFVMLGLTLSALAVARRAMIKKASPLREAKVVQTNRYAAGQGRTN